MAGKSEKENEFLLKSENNCFRLPATCDLNPFSTPKIEKRFSFLKKQFFFSRESGKAGLAAKMVSDGPLSKSAWKETNG